ncbi:hypothetical protein [Saccharopolyspora sp. NPDC049357]|uniref:hypothetical protein n=1 Tax=Saccharopolyspora sp. NPDC049357 TaxID=3154507 RepID=UPI003437E097
MNNRLRASAGIAMLLAAAAGVAAVAINEPSPIPVLVGTFVVGLLAAAASIAGVAASWIDLRLGSTTSSPIEDEETAFKRRMAELSRHLDQSQKLIEELTAEVRAKKASLEELTAEAEEKQRLASIHADAAAAVETMFARKNEELVQRLQRQSRSRALISLVLSGVILALVVGVAGNYVFTWISTGQMPPVILP